MPDPQPAGTQPSSRTPSTNGRERRRHLHLRELIDEMLASLRAAAKQDLFTVAERADAEEQLAAIMERVHIEALRVGARPS